MQRKLFVVYEKGARSNRRFNYAIAVNHFDAKKSARCRQVFVVAELVVSGIQCNKMTTCNAKISHPADIYHKINNSKAVSWPKVHPRNLGYVISMQGLQPILDLY